MGKPLSHFAFLDWCNKGRGMCYPVYGMVHIEEHLLLIGMSGPCSSASEFAHSNSELSYAFLLISC